MWVHSIVMQATVCSGALACLAVTAGMRSMAGLTALNALGLGPDLV